LINFVDATNDANHYTKPPPVLRSSFISFNSVGCDCSSVCKWRYRIN